MRDYGKVSVKFWSSGSGKRLRGHPRAQVVALYLLSGSSSTMTGLYYVPLVLMAHETGMTLDEVRDALVVIKEMGFASYDEDRELAWVHNAAEFEFGEGLKLGDNKIAGIKKHLRSFGEHPFVDAFEERYGVQLRLFEAPTKGLRRGFVENGQSSAEGASKGLIRAIEGAQNQDPDPEQDPEPDQDCARAPRPSAAKEFRGTRQQEHLVAGMWQERERKAGLPGVPLSEDDMRKLGAVIRIANTAKIEIGAVLNEWFRPEWRETFGGGIAQLEKRARDVINALADPKLRPKLKGAQTPTQGQPQVPARYRVDLAAETRALMAQGGDHGQAAE